jgi:hypothetical protein
MTGRNRVLRFFMALVVLLGTAFQSVTGNAATAAFDPHGSIEDCAEPCHQWLLEDPARTVTLNVKLRIGRTASVQYAADWVHEKSCPEGRVEVARAIAGYRSAFVEPLLRRGFCPHVVLDGISSDAPYLASLDLNNVINDVERSRMLTPEEYGRSVVPAMKKMLASQEPKRWATLSLFVSSAVPNAHLLTTEIAEALADPNPSTVQADTDGDSSKAKSILNMTEPITGNRDLVGALLNELDSNPALSANPGYQSLLDHLAGVTSSVPTWGSPPVCANVDRIARHLPWGPDVKKDTTFLATLSRCDTGSENLLRLSLRDSRPAVVATGLRVWWAGVAGGQTAARNVADGVIALVMNGDLPNAVAAPTYVTKPQSQSLIKDSSAVEETALGLSALGLLSGTVERLNAAGRTDQARMLFDGLERGVKRLAQ